MSNDAAYYIVIPGSVRADKNLNAEQKYLYGELAAKCNVKGYCWATNATLCEILSCTERTLQRNLLELQRGKHIRVELHRGGQGTSRRIWLIDSRDFKRATETAPPIPAENGEPTRQSVEKSPAENGDQNTLREYSNGKKQSPAPSAAGGVKPAEGKKKTGEIRPPRPHWQAFVDTFHEDYKANNHGEEPSIDGRPVGDLAKLYDRLQSRAKRKSLVWNEAGVKGMLQYFLKIARKNPWLKEHWLVKNLLEQYDAIYAREAAEGKPAAAEKTGPPASNEGPAAHIQYIVERHREGNLDERIIDQYWYDRLVSLKLAGISDFERYPGETPEAKKIAAFKHWLTLQKAPA